MKTGIKYLLETIRINFSKRLESTTRSFLFFLKISLIISLIATIANILLFNSHNLLDQICHPGNYAFPMMLGGLFFKHCFYNILLSLFATIMSLFLLLFFLIVLLNILNALFDILVALISSDLNLKLWVNFAKSEFEVDKKQFDFVRAVHSIFPYAFVGMIVFLLIKTVYISDYYTKIQFNYEHLIEYINSLVLYISPIIFFIASAYVTIVRYIHYKKTLFSQRSKYILFNKMSLTSSALWAIYYICLIPLIVLVMSYIIDTSSEVGHRAFDQYYFNKMLPFAYEYGDEIDSIGNQPPETFIDEVRVFRNVIPFEKIYFKIWTKSIVNSLNRSIIYSIPIIIIFSFIAPLLLAKGKKRSFLLFLIHSVVILTVSEIFAFYIERNYLASNSILPTSILISLGIGIAIHALFFKGKALIDSTGVSNILGLPHPSKSITDSLALEGATFLEIQGEKWFLKGDLESLFRKNPRLKEELRNKTL